VRKRVREFIHAMIEVNSTCRCPGHATLAVRSPRLAMARARLAYGHRHGHRSRSLLGSFGRVEIEVPRARLNTPMARRRSGEQGAAGLSAAARLSLTR